MLGKAHCWKSSLSLHLESLMDTHSTNKLKTICLTWMCVTLILLPFLGHLLEPPVIVMEAYCSDKTAPYSGTNNSLGEDCGGIRVLVELDPQHSDRYTELLQNGKIKDVPVEFYHVDFHYFNGDPVSYRTSPLKAVVVDTTRKDYTGMVDRFVSENITEYLSAQEQVELSAAYRRVRSDFRTSDTVARLNKKVSESDRLKGRNISIELRENDLDEWKRQMAISVDTIPFEQIGFGTQNTIKVELAIENSAGRCEHPTF